MYSPRYTPALLMMALLAVPVVGANAQTGGGGEVNITIEPTVNGKPPKDVQCVERIEVIKGTFELTTFTGVKKQLPPGVYCVTATGEVSTASAAQGESGGNPPGGSTPPTCVTQCSQ